MTEILKKERLPNPEYDENTLMQELEEYRISGASFMKSAIGYTDEKIKKLGTLTLFLSFQNNFWIRLRYATEVLDENGSIRSPDAEWVGFIEPFHLNTIHEIIRNLKLDQTVLRDLGKRKTIGSRLNDTETEMIMKVYIEMRKLGFTHEELLG